MTPHYYEGFQGSYPCKFQREDMMCMFGSEADESDGLLYYAPAHAPTIIPQNPFKNQRNKSQPCKFFTNSTQCEEPGAKPQVNKWTKIPKSRNQYTIVMSNEASSYCPVLEDKSYLKLFDLDMTYKLNSTLPIPYKVFDVTEHRIMNSFHNRLELVAYLNRNCHPFSRRDEILKNLHDFGVPIFALGACKVDGSEDVGSFGSGHIRRDSGADWSREKVKLFTSYRVCISIENSVDYDYVSEKLWDAFEAGCVPVYYGAPNIHEFLPHNSSVILITDPNDLFAVAEEIVRVVQDYSAYLEYMKWKTLPFEALNVGYQKLLKLQKNSPASPKDYDKYVVEWREHFQQAADDFEVERGLNHIFSQDWAPSVDLIGDALKAARRVDSFATSVRILEALEHKCHNKAQYQEYKTHLKPLLSELGIVDKHELGEIRSVREKSWWADAYIF